MQSSQSGIISWFAKNPVAANLVMLFIVVAGAISVSSISKDMFPRSDIPIIKISAPYPGAAPIEVEKAVILPMESALEGLKGVKKISAKASRDMASITLEIEANEDLNEVMVQVENRIDGIVNFPEDLEKPTVKKADFFGWVMGVSVSGPMDVRQRKILGQQVYDDLMALPEVKKVFLWGVDNYEISIEVKEARLRELNLTLGEVAQVLRASSLDLPAGIIRAEAGNVLVRTQGKAYVGAEFANLVLRSQADGTQLLLSDVAEIKDGFVESNSMVRFDQEEAFNLGIMSLEDQNLLTISDSIKSYIEKKRTTLPKDLSLHYFSDESYHLRGRLDMMIENLAMGAVLVAIVLGLFLNLRVAFWVMLGIPVSFLGAFWLMPVNPYPVTVNVLSLFAFIMVLGIVVDDAIVIGESVFDEVDGDYKKKLSEGMDPNTIYKASIETVVAGAQKVATPSTIGVLTTIAAFAPILFIGGSQAAFLESISVVVILCLIFSLVESKLILPAHLVGLEFGRPSSSKFAFIGRWQKAVDKGLSKFINEVFQPNLLMLIKNRYSTLAVFLGLLIIAFATLSSGIARFEFFPNVPGDDVKAQIIMQDGSSTESLQETILAVESAIYKVDADYRAKYPESVGLVEHVQFNTQSDIQVIFRVMLTHAELRAVDAVEIERLWRNAVGPLAGVRKQRYYSSEGPGGGANINLSLSGADPDELTLAGAELQEKLAEYTGVFDVYNSQGSGGREVLVSLKPYASQVGVSLADVARQVRQAFYGEEVQRIQRDTETLKVMVRYPLEERRSIATLENMHIRTNTGEAIAIGEVANIRLGLGLTAISRIDRKRTVTITANNDSEMVQSGTVIGDIKDSFIPALLAKYPSVQFGLGGASEEQGILIQRMFMSFAASLFLIYGLLAVPLRSYMQPLVIMSVIPFGFIGAVIGHIIFDVSINMLSVFGLIALSGVVVNDSLILVEFANRARADNTSIDEALLIAGKRRFRAILLTTMTTFVGLLPMLFETSVQAQFVIPMALSLSFGILFATSITLVIVPCLYRVVYDLRDSKRFVDPVLQDGL